MELFAHRTLSVAALLLAACGDAGSGPQGGEGGAGGEGGEGAGLPQVFDCAKAPTEAVSRRVLAGARGYHGLAFDHEGFIFGVDTEDTLIRASYDGAWSPWLPNVVAEQMAIARSGHLFLATFDGLLGITPDAQRYTINAEIFGYGLRIAPDDSIWVAEYRALRRVSPITGIAETVVTVPDFIDETYAHAFDFSPDHRRVYLGMTGFNPGQVRVLDLDDDLRPVGELRSFVDLTPGDKVWIDGVATDACGNVYVANFSSSQLFRVTPAGEATLFWDWSGDDTEYGHGVVFGNGRGGFRSDALYAPMPYDGHAVQEIVVGVPGREWLGAFGGEVVNAP